MPARTLYRCALLACVCMLVSAESFAQEVFIYKGAKWRFGAFGGLNYNFVGAGIQQLDLIPDSNDFRIFRLNDGTGFGPYFGGLVEYNSGEFLGFQVRVGYDGRGASLEEQKDSSGAVNKFTTRVSYISIEPGLRMNLGSPDLHAVLGPSIHIALKHQFDYDPADDNVPNISGKEIDQWNGMTFGVWGGLGYDINLSGPASPARWYLTPFAEGSWIFDQRKSDFPKIQDNVDDVWSTITVRAGVQLKWGESPAPPPVERVELMSETATMDVTVRAPSGVRSRPVVEEFFPLNNYIFFDKGSTSVPTRYASMNSSQASNFKEVSLFEDTSPGPAEINPQKPNRSARQIAVYHNSLNIYGDRLRNNPSATITIVGSAPDEKEGMAQAEAVKNYLVTTYGISADRITTKSQKRPSNASGTRATPKEDLPLVAEENRRVEIMSNDPNIMKPVSIRTTQGEPLDNDLVLDLRSGVTINEWTVAITGNGTTETFGPYKGLDQRISARQLLQNRDRGTYTAHVTATTSDGSQIIKDIPFELHKKDETTPVSEQRYSILFEFDESKTVQMYDDFLRKEVVPRISDGSTVFIYGYTDKIGEDDYNTKLSIRRTNEAQKILADELGKQGRTVSFYTYGFGEGEYLSPFQNTSPEGRYYNRTVVIEIVPGSR